MSAHSIIKCSCGKVILQCRCMGPKAETIRQHPACEEGMKK